MALSIDNQPITDQQGGLFSTQIPLNAIQSIETVYGGTPAEYGDKTSLVVTTVTRTVEELLSPEFQFAVRESLALKSSRAHAALEWAAFGR